MVGCSAGFEPATRNLKLDLTYDRSRKFLADDQSKLFKFRVAGECKVENGFVKLNIEFQKKNFCR